MNTTSFKPADAVMHAPAYLDSAAIIDFLNNPETSILNCHPVKNPASLISIRDQIFDFTEVNSWARKEFTTFQGDSTQIKFKRCIFIGGIRFSNCEFEYITFENCQFIKPKNWLGREPENMPSLSLHQTFGKGVNIEKSFFENPIEIFGHGPANVSMHTVTAPHVWLQSMNAKSSTLAVQNFIGGYIHLPNEENKFKQIASCDWSLSSFGETRQRIMVTKHNR